MIVESYFYHLNKTAYFVVLISMSLGGNPIEQQYCCVKVSVIDT